jgi:hypothetical protein
MIQAVQGPLAMFGNGNKVREVRFGSKARRVLS